MSTKDIVNKYREMKGFTDNEAWFIFRIAAVTEAVGWSLLISGIAIGKYILPGNNVAVQIAGRIHGMLFLFYIAAVIIFAPSMNWSIKRTIIGGLFSVVPYGSIMFEQWEKRRRRISSMNKLNSLVLYLSFSNN